MAQRILSDDELRLILTICEHEPTDEQRLSQLLGWPSAHISNMIQTLIDATPGCAYGIVTAKMSRYGGSTIQHASDIRITSLGKQVCQTGSKIVNC